MSGGSLNYLCFAEPTELINRVGDMEEVEAELIRRNYLDIAKDVRRLIEYTLSAHNRISVLQENLNEIFRAVEWYHSADIGEDSLIKRFDQYRNGTTE